MLVQELDYEIKDRKGSENPILDLLSQIVINEAHEIPIFECFSDEQLFRAQVERLHVNIVNYLVTREMRRGWTKDDRTFFFLQW